MYSSTTWEWETADAYSETIQGGLCAGCQHLFSENQHCVAQPLLAVLLASCPQGQLALKEHLAIAEEIIM